MCTNETASSSTGEVSRRARSSAASGAIAADRLSRTRTPGSGWSPSTVAISSSWQPGELASDTGADALAKRGVGANSRSKAGIAA